MKNRKTLGIVGGTIIACSLLLTLLWHPKEAGAVATEGAGDGLYWARSGLIAAANPLAQEGDPAIPPSDQACQLCHQDSSRATEIAAG